MTIGRVDLKAGIYDVPHVKVNGPKIKNAGIPLTNEALKKDVLEKGNAILEEIAPGATKNQAKGAKAKEAVSKLAENAKGILGKAFSAVKKHKVIATLAAAAGVIAAGVGLYAANQAKKEDAAVEAHQA